MADWTDIQDSALDPDAPVTSELAYAFRDNPIAIAEGAPGAPRVSLWALGSTQRVAYSAAMANTKMYTINNLDDVGTLINFGAILPQASGADGSFEIWLSDDNGSSFAAVTTITIPGSSNITFSAAIINLETGYYHFNAAVTGTLNLPSGPVNAIRFRRNATGTATGFSWIPISGKG